MEPSWREPAAVSVRDMDFSYEKDRHNPLWGLDLPYVFVPDWPDVRIIPGKRPFVTTPHAFRAYTRVGRQVWADTADSYDKVRWQLEQRVRDMAGVT